MADIYSVKVNRRDGAIEVSGDKQWVEEKLAQLADVYTAPLESEGASGKTRRTVSRKRGASKDGKGSASRPARRKAGTPKRISGLELAPKGKQSFEDFVAEKQPGNQHDRNVVSVYYLSEIAAMPVTIDHVYTCYRHQDWPVPTNLRNSLQVTSSSKAYLDTSDGDDIKVEPKGMNRVERGLPEKKDS